VPHYPSEGVLQANVPAHQLADVGIGRIVSSPYVHAVQSIAPLAERLALRS